MNLIKWMSPGATIPTVHRRTAKPPPGGPAQTLSIGQHKNGRPSKARVQSIGVIGEMRIEAPLSLSLSLFLPLSLSPSLSLSLLVESSFHGSPSRTLWLGSLSRGTRGLRGPVLKKLEAWPTFFLRGGGARLRSPLTLLHPSGSLFAPKWIICFKLIMYF